jgi:hypothetical protein
MDHPTSKAWEVPVVSDLGSLEELTAICNTAGSGDFNFPGSESHNTELLSPFCVSD